MKFKNLSFGDIISLGFCFFYSILIVVLPFYVLFRFKSSSKCFHAGIGEDSTKKSRKIYPVLFMARRWIFISLSFAFTKREKVDAYIQVGALMCTQLFAASYIISRKPLPSNNVEFVNDTFVLC